MLTLYRRHLKACPHRNDGRKYRRCRCPIWVDGSVKSIEIRQSLKERSWEEAEIEKQKLEQRLSHPEEAAKEVEAITVERAWEDFTCDAQARGLREPTLNKYRYLRRQMEQFAKDQRIRYLCEFNLEVLRAWRATWPNKNLSALKKLELVRCFFRFAHDAGQIPDNPARKVRSPKVTQSQTLPFTQDEMVRIMAALNNYADPRSRTGRKMRALVLLLRYSGLRIGDAVTLSRERITGDKLFLYTAKAGTPVYLPLAPLVLAALDAAASPTGPYYFWTGESKPKTAISDWQCKLKRLFELAEVPNGHAHRFRDTFATGLLLQGVALEQVSILLAHSSIRITERHYAPWVRSRQEQLEAEVRRTWGDVLQETKGTPTAAQERTVN
ncbi:MAG: tyrosine-type recombinase/integrase [Terriglobia bacterium]|jgi:integrase